MQWLNRIPMQFYQIFLYLLNLVSIYTRKVWVINNKRGKNYLSPFFIFKSSDRF